MNNKKMNIALGAGGHAKVVIELCEKVGIKIDAISHNSNKKLKNFLNIKVLNSDSEIYELDRDKISLINAIGSIPGSDNRWNISSKMRSKGFHFISLIHPNSHVSDSSIISEGAQIMAGCIIQAGVKIGKDCIINTGSIIDHDCTIEENCHIAPGSVLSGNVLVKRNAHIGTGAKIIQNITIGKNAVIAAGSVVYKDIPDNTTLIQKK